MSNVHAAGVLSNRANASRFLRLLAAGLISTVSAGALRADTEPTTRPAHVRHIRFAPNVESAPSNLGTATSRGHVNDPNLAASVVAPQANEGLTTQESPSLFWYTTKPTTAKIEIDLVKADDLSDVKPLIKVVFHDPMICGLQRLDLAKAGVKLQSNVRYKWSVSLIDPEGRSGDIISQAIIRRVAVPEKLATSLARSAGSDERINLFAESGIWYDMLGLLCDAIDAHPGDSQLRQQRAALLDQAGLPVLPKELKNWATGTGPK